MHGSLYSMILHLFLFLKRNESLNSCGWCSNNSCGESVMHGSLYSMIIHLRIPKTLVAYSRSKAVNFSCSFHNIGLQHKRRRSDLYTIPRVRTSRRKALETIPFNRTISLERQRWLLPTVVLYASASIKKYDAIW